MKNLLTVLILLLSNLAIGQVSYSVSYHSNVGNPGGLNNENSTNVWNVHMQHGPVNQWANSIPVPIPFEFYGDPVTTFNVSQNGILTFNPSVSATPPGDNTNLPSTQLPDKSICAFWDIHNSNYSFGWLSSKTFGTFPNRQFWIRWSEWGHGSSGSTPAFSIVLEETTNKVYIVDEFLGNGVTSTIGLQNSNTEYVQYGNANIAPTSPSHQPNDNNYYEFTPISAPDISPQSLTNNSYDFCGTNDSIPINVTIINSGLATSNILIDAYLTGAVTTNLSTTYTATLLMNVPTSVFLGMVPVSATGTVDVTVITTNQGDNNAQNDTLQETITIQHLIESTETIQDETISGANDGSITLALTQGTAPYTVLWSDGQTGATIQNLSPGTYTATITDANGCLLVESYQVLPGIMTSIVDLESTNKIDFRLYPNPAQRFVTIEIESTQSNDVLIALISIDERLLEQYNQQTIQSNKMELDVSHYPKGMYWIKVRMDGNETIKKLVIL